MARYAYYCDRCNEEREITKSVADYARPEQCATCTTEMRRIFTTTPVHFKGGCWAKDNYSREFVSYKMKSGETKTYQINETAKKKVD